MPRALAEDVAAFAAAHGGRTELVRVAVTGAQVQEYGLPSAPAKASDRRSYDEAGTTQAEALPPDVLARLLTDAITQRRDPAVHEQLLAREALERAQLLEELNLS